MDPALALDGEYDPEFERKFYGEGGVKMLLESLANFTTYQPCPIVSRKSYLAEGFNTL